MQVKDRNKNRRSIGTLALVSLFCQLGLAPAIALASGHPNFAFVFAAVVALSIGGGTGVASAFVAGLVYDLSTTGPIGLMALLLTIAAYILGIEVRDRISEEPSMTLIPFSIAAFAVSLLYHLSMFLYGQADSLFGAIFFRTLPTTVLTILAYLPYLYFLGRTRQGGLRMGQGRGAHSSRYTMGNR